MYVVKCFQHLLELENTRKHTSRIALMLVACALKLTKIPPSLESIRNVYILAIKVISVLYVDMQQHIREF
jgi:MFS-type transporter involved in bile tolerance (Atg22 family)